MRVKRAASLANQERSRAVEYLSSHPHPPPTNPLCLRCTGEYRISQAVDPVRGTGSSTPTGPNKRPANVVESRTLPLDAPNREPDRSQHRTLSSGDEVLRAENGAPMHPVPQRDRGDGLPYTKRVSDYSEFLGISIGA
jgi:hypothetical protein